MRPWLGKRGPSSTGATCTNSFCLQGHADAFFHLGMMHLHGWGVPASLNQAQHYLNMAGRLGHILAEYNLALILLQSRQAGNCAAFLRIWQDMRARKNIFRARPFVCYHKSHNHCPLESCTRLICKQRGLRVELLCLQALQNWRKLMLMSRLTVADGVQGDL